MNVLEMVLVSFVTFNIVILTSNEIKNKVWWSGYFMCCVNYIISLYFGQFINIPVKNNFYFNDIFIFIPYIFISDLVFYSTHRIMHYKYLYKYHKQHHLWNEPVSTSFLDSNPFEHLLVNIPTVIVPLYVIHISDIQQMIWIIIVTTQSILSHMELYDINGPHIKHHKLRKVNYGTGLYLCDRLLGTYK